MFTIVCFTLRRQVLFTYLDKSGNTIARTNRPYKDKQCWIVIDYCGILKHLDKALNFNESEIESCLIDFEELKRKLTVLIDEFKNIFAGVDITNLWQCLKHIEANKLESRVNDVYKKLQVTYETIAPDPFCWTIIRITNGQRNSW